MCVFWETHWIVELQIQNAKRSASKAYWTLSFYTIKKFFDRSLTQLQWPRLWIWWSDVCDQCRYTNRYDNIMLYSVTDTQQSRFCQQVELGFLDSDDDYGMDLFTSSHLSDQDAEVNVNELETCLEMTNGVGWPRANNLRNGHPWS